MRRRQGFTLVELMVSMALIVFIMTILSQAFITATQSFRDLRAAGELARKLSTAATLLRADLATDHFNGKKRLSDPTFWNNGPPDMGFFRIWQGSPSVLDRTPGGVNFFEGQDSDGIPSYRSVNHMLAMTVKARGNLRSNFYSTTLGSPAGFASLLDPRNGGDSRYQDPTSTNTYNFQWAEPTWFLYPSINPNTNPPQQDTANGTPLYTLYRRLRVAVPDNNLINPVINANQLSNYLGVSCQPDPNNLNNLYFNSAIDLTIPGRRFGMDPVTGLPAINNIQTNVQTIGYGYPPLAYYPVYFNVPINPIDDKAADAILFDVVSFDVRVLLAGQPDFVDFVDIATVDYLYPNGNPKFPPPPALPAPPQSPGPWVFDTWSKIPAAAGSAFPPDYSQWNVPGNNTSLPTWKSTNNTGPIIKAIKITLRVWDANTNLTRQVTIVQEM